MSLFRYRALNAAGHTVSGNIEADDLSSLEKRLRQAGIWLLEAEAGAAGDAAGPVSGLRMSRGELIGFFMQMSLLLRAGITLPEALSRLAEDGAGGRLGEVVSALREDIVVGVPLHQSMARFPRVFPAAITAVVQAGEVSGRLPDVFESLCSYQEWLDGLVADIRQALIYPVMVMSAALALVLLLFTLVVPRFVVLLTDLSLEVPLLTRVVMGISQVLLQAWPVLVALLVGGPVLLKIALRTSPPFARAFDRGLMRLPVFGPLVAMFALSRFTRNLGMLYEAGIPLMRGLEICRQLVGNRAIAHAVAEAREGVMGGTPFSKCLSRQKIFPATVVTMIATGEASGTLDVALRSVSDYYNKIIPRRIKVVFSIFDPVMMVTLIAVVGTVALAVILPILQLWNVR
jgi:type II secretory pathway component PulF